MKIKHDDIIIDPNDPFANCVLGRKKYANILTSVISAYSDGFVLAINNEWGTGKTTFIKMWEQQLKGQGFQTLYFNAWENDFELDPLVALMAEFKSLKPTSKKEFKSVLEKGAVLTKNILPHLIKAIASKYVDTEILSEAIGDTTKGATQILEGSIKDFVSKKEGLKEFRKSLTEYVELTKGDKPIVFIIDELDRCRPNYAVELLEQVKHFFTVPGIVFVLSIDKKQLGHAVQGLYGSEHINADGYLRRFIDIEYSIPQPDAKLFCKYLYEYFQFDTFFNLDIRKRHQELREDGRQFVEMSWMLFEKANLSLRQQEKVFSHARLGLTIFGENEYVFPLLYFVLVFLRISNHEFYSKMKLKEYTLDELLKEFREKLPKNISEYEIRWFIHLEASLVYMYNIYTAEHPRKLVVKDKDTGLDRPVVRSYFDNSENKNAFISFLQSFESSWHSSVGLDHLFNRIDLLNEVKA